MHTFAAVVGCTVEEDKLVLLQTVVEAAVAAAAVKPSASAVAVADITVAVEVSNLALISAVAQVVVVCNHS